MNFEKAKHEREDDERSILCYGDAVVRSEFLKKR
jgi:hypothetical protein